MEAEDESYYTDGIITTKLPMGFRFRPSEEELFYYALQRAIEGPSVGEGIFKECNLYEIEPKDLLQEAEEGVVYVCTKLKKKTNQGKRIDRTVAGKGTWKEKDKPKTIYSPGNQQIIGWRRGFAYTPNSKSLATGDDQYRMKEYSLHNSVLTHAKFKDYVLCKIKKLKQKKKNKEDGEDSQQLRDCLASMLPEVEDMELANTSANISGLSPDKLRPGTHSAPSQPGQQLEEFPNGDRAMVELVPMSIENQAHSFPCGVPSSCGFLHPTSSAALRGSSPSTPFQLEPALDDLSAILGTGHQAAKGSCQPAYGFNDFASTAPVTWQSPSTAFQPEPATIEESATLGSGLQATPDFPQAAYGVLDSASAAPLINPSPSTEVQSISAAIQSIDQYLNDDVYDYSLDCTMVSGEELRDFELRLLENH